MRQRAGACERRARERDDAKPSRVDRRDLPLPVLLDILGVGADPSELKGEIGHEVADKIARLSMLKP